MSVFGITFVKDADVASDAAIGLAKLENGWKYKLVQKQSPSAVTSVTFSGLSGQKNYLLVYDLKYNGNDTSVILGLRFNNDSALKYDYVKQSNTTWSETNNDAEIELWNGDFQDNDFAASGHVFIEAKSSKFRNHSAGFIHENSARRLGVSFARYGHWHPTAQTEVTRIDLVLIAGTSNLTGDVWLYEAIEA